jgi:hypothetical protein
VRKLILALAIGIGLAAIGALIFRREAYHHLALTACFDDAQGLETGARVRVAGVVVGHVVAVRARPDHKDCPAQIQIDLTTPYELKIPSDAVAQVRSEGLLDSQYVEIDTKNATAPPAGNHAVLKGTPGAVPALDSIRTLAEKTLRVVGPHGGVVVPESVAVLIRPILDERQKLLSGERHDEHQLNQLLYALRHKQGRDADEGLVILMCFDLGESQEVEDAVIARGPQMLPDLNQYLDQVPAVSGRTYPDRMTKGALSKSDAFLGAIQAINRGRKSSGENPRG